MASGRGRATDCRDRRQPGRGGSLAVAGLSPSVRVVMPDVPFLCHYLRATEIQATHPYEEISKFCQTHRDKVGTVFRTLACFDGVNFAARATARALFSVALMDEVCAPSTVLACVWMIPWRRR